MTTTDEHPTPAPAPAPAPPEPAKTPTPTKPDVDETTTPTDAKHDPDAPRNDDVNKPEEKPKTPPPATNGVAAAKPRARTPEPDEEVDWEEGELEEGEIEDGNESDFEIETEQRTSTPPAPDDESVQFNVGCGIPCRFYNHDRCTRGATCGYLHGPDDKSVRDTHGKNVCRYFLLGDCKFGVPKCAYSHKKDYLPEGGWWESEEGIEQEKARVEDEKRAAKDAWKEQQRAERATRRRQQQHQQNQQHQQHQQHQHQHQQNNRGRRGGGNAGGPGRSRNQQQGAYAHLNVAPQPGLSHATMQQAMSVTELAERMQNFGFTERQLLDLAAYGIKPWDDGAWTALNMLYHY